MKNTFVKIAAAGLLAVAIVNTPMPCRAADTNTMAADTTAPAKHQILPFHGKLAAVDTNAMTLTVGKRTFAITSETRITKDGEPATLSDGVVGENVGGAYKKAADGTLNATTINFGIKPGAKKKKESTAPAN